MSAQVQLVLAVATIERLHEEGLTARVTAEISGQEGQFLRLLQGDI